MLNVDLIKRNKVQASSNKNKNCWIPVQRLWSVKHEKRDTQALLCTVRQRWETFKQDVMTKSQERTMKKLC